MKHIITLILITALPLFLIPLYAVEEHHQETKGMENDKPGMDTDMMHKHMKEMMQMMEKIHKTEDPEEHARLMHKHMQSMHEGMAMMRGKGNETGMMGKKKKEGEHEMETEKKDEHIMRLEKRLDMMQMMMEQMMEHQSEAESDGMRMHGR